MKTNAPRPLAHPRPDLEHTKPDRVEDGRRPGRALQADLLEGVHEHVGGAVQKKTELVGRESMAGGAVRMQEGLVILDESFRASACTIDLLIQKLGGSIRDGGGHKARIGFALGNLGLVEDALRVLPALGLVVETGKEPHRLLFGAFLRLSQRLLHQRRPLARGFQPRITAQSVAVIGVLVAAGDLKDALPQEVLAGMVDVTGMAPIRQRRHHTLKDAGPGFGLSQQQQAPILSGAAPMEIGFDFLARDPCKRQGVLRSLHRGVLSKWFVVLSAPNLGINNHLYRGHRGFF